MSTIKVTNIQNPSSGTDDIQIATNGDVTIGGLSLDAAAAADSVNLDASGRLLVGTSSSSAVTSTVFQGNSTSPTGAGVVHISRGSSANAAGDGCGIIRFSDNSQNIRAEIEGSSDGAGGTNDYPGRLVFSTTKDGASSPVERFRINNNGLFAMVADAGDAFYLGANAGAGTANYLMSLRHSATAGTMYSGTECLKIFTNGNVQNTNNSYGSLSDIKLKENIVDANSQWDDLKALQVRNYNFKEGQTHTQIGLVAQEVELVSPGLVTESPDRDDEGNDLGTVTKSVNYSVLYMKAVKALQEAMERIEQLESEMAAVKAQLA